jgi:hypothetical protein
LRQVRENELQPPGNRRARQIGGSLSLDRCGDHAVIEYRVVPDRKGASRDGRLLSDKAPWVSLGDVDGDLKGSGYAARMRDTDTWPRSLHRRLRSPEN